MDVVVPWSGGCGMGVSGTPCGRVAQCTKDHDVETKRRKPQSGHGEGRLVFASTRLRIALASELKSVHASFTAYE